MKKIIIAAVIVILAGAVAFKYYSKKRASAKPSYQTLQVSRGSITRTVETTGEVAPLNRVEVKPSIAGRIDKLLVNEGDVVKSGQILAYMSSTDRVAILDAARAKGEAEVAKWEDAYKPSPIISPLSGKVILRNVVEGQTVGTSDVVFALADDLIVVANVDESDIGAIREGQGADITLDAYPDRKVRASVFQILQEGTSSSNVITYKVKLRPYRVPEFFKSQMTANITVETARKTNILLLPLQAIKEGKRGRTVLTGDIAKPEPTPVTTGLEDGMNAEILSGLTEGESVYVAGMKYTPQVSESSSNPFMPGRPKAQKANTTNGKKSSSSGGGNPPPPGM